MYEEADMANTAVVRARVNEDIKEKASEILEKSGLTVSDAIRITLNRIVTEKNFPLIPNALTAETIREGRKGKGISKAKDVADLMKQLEENE
jgi:DNA-damage-inducible protein J